MITTHILDLSSAAGPFDHIEEGDPLIIPLTEQQLHPHGYVYRVNEFDLPLEVVMRQRGSMIAYWTGLGRGDECRELLAAQGMSVMTWLLPRGAEIREVDDE